MRFGLTYTDGRTEDVAVAPMALIGWERWSGRRMSDLSDKGFGLEDMCRMAYEQVRLSGGTTAEFDAWVTTVDDIEAQEAADPTSGDGGA